MKMSMRGFDQYGMPIPLAYLEPYFKKAYPGKDYEVDHVKMAVLYLVEDVATSDGVTSGLRTYKSAPLDECALPKPVREN